MHRLLLVLVAFLGIIAPRAPAAAEDFAPAYGDGLHTDLQVASWLGDRERVLALLESGVEVDAVVGENGVTPLMFASAAGHADVIRLLIESGADVEASSDRGDTALTRAIAADCPGCVRELLDAGADMQDKGGASTSPFQLALTTRSEDVLLLLVDHAVSRGLDLDVMFRSSIGRRAPVAVLRRLLERGAQESAQYESGLTPLHIAARASYREALCLLLQAGANINVADNQGNTPVMSIPLDRPEAEELVLELVRSGAHLQYQKPADARRNRSRIGDILRTMSTDGLAELVALDVVVGGIRPGHMHQVFEPPIMATDSSRLRLLVRLIGRELCAQPIADVFFEHVDEPELAQVRLHDLLREVQIEVHNIEWALGRTPLHQSDSSARAVLAAVDLGVNPNAPDSNGYRPLDSVLRKRGTAAVARLQLLLSVGADPNLESRGGFPIDRAIASGDVALARAFFDAGASVDGTRRLHRVLNSALFSDEMMAVCVDNGVSFDRLPSVEWSLLDGLVNDADGAASSTRFAQDVVQMSRAFDRLDRCLRQIRRYHAFGGDLNLRTYKGATALHRAKEPEVLLLLLELGARPDLLDADGINALHSHLGLGPSASVDVISNLARDPSILTSTGYRERTALVTAAENCDADVVLALVRLGADPNEKDANGVLPIRAALNDLLFRSKFNLYPAAGEQESLAVDRRHEVVQALIDAGSDLSIANAAGQSLLHGPVNSHFGQTIVAAGVSVDQRDRDGNTPLLAAVKRWDFLTIRSLLRLGADPMLADNTGKRPIDFIREPSDEVHYSYYSTGSEALNALHEEVFWELHDASQLY